MRYATLIAAALLVGCASPPVLTPADLQHAGTGVLCTHVSTLTTTVRTVYVQADRIDGTLAIGADCTVAAQSTAPKGAK